MRGSREWTISCSVFYAMEIYFEKKAMPSLGHLLYTVMCSVFLLDETVAARQNIALQKTVYQSTTLNYNGYSWTAGLAVDNKTRFTGDGCRCCAGVGYEDPAKGPWWEIDLGEAVRVGKVKVFGRNDSGYEQLYGFKMFVSETTSYNYSSSPFVYINNVTSEEYLANQGVTDVLFGDTPIRYVALALHKARHKNPQVLMVVCEVQVFMPCDNYHFEPDCAQCHCDGAPCNKSSGLCLGGCTPGWQGQRCDQICNQGTFGDNCSGICNCYNNTCDPTSGQCPPGGCMPGYHGDKCNMECGNNTYGQDCLLTCGHCYNGEQCNPEYGQCKRCAPGYSGNLCNQTCSHMSYGENCTMTCGSCSDNITCNHVTGICQSCAAGYHGDICNSTCGPGTFGLDCNYTCGKCRNNSECDIFTGNCSDGCAPGYQGDQCSNSCNAGFYGQGCTVPCAKCMDNAVCNVSTGNCPGDCFAGYKGDRCDEECVAGYHGINCRLECGHCYNNETCNSTNGECVSGCAEGFIGQTCQQRLKPKPPDNNTAVTAVVVAVIVLLVLIALVVVFLLLRRRNIPWRGHSRSTDKGINTAERENDEIGDQMSPSQGQSMMANQTVPEQKKDSLPQTTDICISKLWDYIHAKKENFSEMFNKEFETLKNGLLHPHEVGSLDENRAKHKYRDMFAYDFNRVILTRADDQDTDYINASYIDGYDQPKKFIASQGPIKSMVEDFWLMIWQQKAEIVVMLTNVMEFGKVKCIQYWPESGDKTFGDVTVKLLGTETYLDYDVCHLEMSASDEDCQRLTQFHFKSWPDKHVPDTAWCLVKFWRAVDSAATTDSPIVVHCSAGVGRTGTFIAMDNLIYQGKLTGSVNPLMIVEDLRNQRINMVQTQDQYVYLHEAVAEAFLFGTHYIWSNQYEDYYNFMTQQDDTKGKLRLQIQFELIESSFEISDEEQDNLYSNLRGNDRSERCKGFEPIYLQNYCDKETFIICGMPEKIRPLELWAFVLDLNVNTAVVIPDSQKPLFGGNICGKFQHIEVSMVNEDPGDILTEKCFDVNYGADCHTLTVLECKFWPSSEAPNQNITEMVNGLRKVLKIHPPTERSPLLVFCRDGSRQSGMFCALLNELQRVHVDDGHVCFVETVKSFKARKKSIIPSFGQYLLCHNVILSSIQHVPEPDPENVYQNTQSQNELYQNT